MPDRHGNAVATKRFPLRFAMRARYFLMLGVLPLVCDAGSSDLLVMQSTNSNAEITQSPGTHAAVVGNPYTRSIQSVPESRGHLADDLGTFVPQGQKVLATKAGDLNGDGKPDALLVLAPPVSGNENLAEGPARSVLILIRDAKGQLIKTAQNDHLVPCAQCGGLAGDPFSYIRIAGDKFTVVTEGGSREHWSNEYTFAYSANQTDWFLSEVKREVTDRDDGKSKSIHLTVRDFGKIAFASFDPSTLPKIELP